MRDNIFCKYFFEDFILIMDIIYYNCIYQNNKMRLFKLRNVHTGEEIKIKAINVDSEIHKYQWSFIRYEQESNQIVYSSYSQRNWDIVSNSKINPKNSLTNE